MGTHNLVNKEGQRAPEVTLRCRHAGDWRDCHTSELFSGRTVIVFALPGAFTPTCSSTHVPRYNELADTFKANGVDEIVCVSVNDPFVMESWQQEQQADNITFLPDGNASFSQAMGMLVDKEDLNFGKRSWRYSMLVKDGIIDKMFIEADVPGDPFEVSDADTMLAYINASAQTPAKVALFTKPGCSHCARAKQALQAAGMKYDEIQLGSGSLSLSTLGAVTGQTTTPQVYVDGERIGTADELEAWLSL